MPCAAEELCKLPDVELIVPNGRDCGHECRGECGGKLHGICGEVEDPDGDSPTHRICHTCISNRNLSNPAKRKQGQGFVLPRFVALLCIAVLYRQRGAILHLFFPSISVAASIYLYLLSSLGHHPTEGGCAGGD